MGRIPVAGSDGRLRHRGVIPSGSNPAERIAGPPAVRFAGAVILAGGRSTRLGGVPKAALMADGVSLLARTVAAAAALVDADATLPQPKRGSRGAPRLPIAVVGPPELLRALVPEAEAVRWVREDPPFSGPAAGLAAGLDALYPTGLYPTDQDPTDQYANGAAEDKKALVLVLACDMPGAPEVVIALASAAAAPGDTAPKGSDGWLGVDGGRDQPLAALYRNGPLRLAVETARRRGELENGSVRRLVASLELTRVMVPPGSTADVDTWDDARALGYSAG